MLKNNCHIFNKRPPNRVIAKFRAKVRILKFGTRKCQSVFFRLFLAAILKNHCHIWNQHPRICLVAKFRAKKNKKILNLGPIMSDFHILGLELENIIVIFEISVLEFPLLQSLVKINFLTFGTKNALFEYFSAGIWKWYCHISNQHPRIYLSATFCEKTKTPKFGIKNALFGYF